MGRAHTADQALRSIELIAKAGFASWTIDLIYGLPQMTLAEWDEQLSIALDHGMPHLSAYCLTVEAKTALAHQVAKGTVHMPEDSDQSAQFDRLMERMEQAGLVHYEISNFGLPGHFSRHNTSYWEGVHYLGIGPSAHSYDGATRRWNVANNMRYAKALEAGERLLGKRDPEPCATHQRTFAHRPAYHRGRALAQAGIGRPGTEPFELRTALGQGPLAGARWTLSFDQGRKALRRPHRLGPVRKRR
jgi:coproporphyrinogen III oxidase-like Fe-S oxidoreductase